MVLLYQKIVKTENEKTSSTKTKSNETALCRTYWQVPYTNNPRGAGVGVSGESCVLIST